MSEVTQSWNLEIQRQTPPDDFGSHSAFLLDSGFTAPVRDTEHLRANSESAVRADLNQRFGVQMREQDGQYVFFYRANGQDNIVASAPTTDAGLTQAKKDVEDFTANRIASIEQRYKVSFAKPGENGIQMAISKSDCSFEEGPMTRAVQPTLPQILAVEEALKRSRPSQMTADGKSGMKIYFLDQQIFNGPVYGSRPALGVFIAEDKDNRRALMMTPEGGRLPATERDVDSPEGRNLMWGIVHEMTHNSQENYWRDRTVPKYVADGMGWETRTINVGKHGKWETHFLKGQNGERFKHMRTERCAGETGWYQLNERGDLLDANGQPAANPKDAARLTNEEVASRALVRPISYYFGNPTEMLSEGLTSYRAGRENRAKLFRESPDLYAVAAKYDERELAHYYGRNADGKTTHVRTPEGYIVERELATERSIKLFEDELKRKS